VTSEERRQHVPLDVARARFVTSPFTRLARTHVFSVAGDALFTMGLAGTVFFAADNLDSARWNVALTLVLTIAPFAVAAPVLGPTLDRMKGGRRWMILASCAGRAVLSTLLIQNFDNLAFYPLAFCMLVLGKSYQIAKSALVPTTVRDDAELIEANSKLSLLSGVAVVAAAIPGAIAWRLGGTDWVLAIADVAFVIGAVLSFRLPAATVAVAPPDDMEKQELRSGAILLAASAMGILRAIVGFVAFLLAFDYKGEDAWKLGVIAGAAQIGFLVGAGLAPRLRRLVEEEYILIGVLFTVGVASAGAAFTEGLLVACLVSFTVGVGSSAGKQAFDSVVQRDAPDANRGRSFARFETRFQLMWVIGALIPVLFPIPLPAGFALMAAVAAFGGVSYWAGLSSANSRAAALVRRLHRQQRVDEDMVLARDLGFGTDGPRLRGGRGGSAAADAAERRRTPPDGLPPPLVPDGPDGQIALPLDEGPNLEWHPDC
jgi:hypothetical protein